MRSSMIVFWVALLSNLLVGNLIWANGDSLQVVTIDQKNYSIHKVAPGQTLYAIAKMYHVEIADLRKVNRLDENSAIKQDDFLIIPVTIQYASNVNIANMAVNPEGAVTHTVKIGETLYSIARQYAPVPVSTIREMNKLTSDTLDIGQVLRIPAVGTPRVMIHNGVGLATRTSEATLTVVKPDSVMVKYDQEMLQRLQMTFATEDSAASVTNTNRGVAHWLDNDSPENVRKFYALHKDVPVGSVIKVRNLVNNREVFVKVIGQLPSTTQFRDIIIKLSAGAANYLDPMDDEFLVEITSHAE